MNNITSITHKEELEKDNFYTIEGKWEAKNVCNTYIDTASRTFATITTSGNHCRFFDIDGNRITKDEFTSKYDSYSGEEFLVVMNKETGEFIIKPNFSGIGRIKQLVLR